MLNKSVFGKVLGLSVVIVLTGCNFESGSSVQKDIIENDDIVLETPSLEVSKNLRHDFTSIKPLYLSPYTVTATKFEETLEVSLIRGNMSCNGECDLPLTGYDSTMFNIATDSLLTDITIKSRSKSFIYYTMSSGWYVVNYHYQGRSWWGESQESCYHGTYEIEPSQWEWDSIDSAFADVRGFGEWRVEL